MKIWKVNSLTFLYIFQLLSDLMFIGGIIATAEYHAASSSMPVYLYRFSVDGNLNLMKKIYNLKDPGTNYHYFYLD